MWNSNGAKGSFPNTNLVQWLSPHTPAHFTEGLQLPPDLNSKCLYISLSQLLSFPQENYTLSTCPSIRYTDRFIVF